MTCRALRPSARPQNLRPTPRSTSVRAARPTSPSFNSPTLMKAFARQFAAVATLVALLSAGMAPLSPAWAEEEFIPFVPDAALQPPALQSDELLAIDMSRI